MIDKLNLRDRNNCSFYWDHCQRLPIDLTFKILRLAQNENDDQKDFASIRLVNRSWKYAVDNFLVYAQIEENNSLSNLLHFKFIQSIDCFCEPPHGEFQLRNYRGSSGSKLRDNSLTILTHFHHLQHLSLSGHRLLTNRALKFIGQLTRLVSLSLHQCPQINSCGLGYLVDLKKLKVFKWTASKQIFIAEKNLVTLTKLTSLEILEISPLKCQHLDFLPDSFSDKMRCVSRLSIQNEKAFYRLANFQNLESLHLESSLVNKTAFKELSRLISLRSLDLRAIDIEKDVRSALTALTNLVNLKIVNVEDGKFLTTMHQLTAFTGVFLKPNLEIYRSLSFLKNLKILDLNFAFFSQTFNWLSLQQLETIKFHHGAFDPSGANSIKTMENLINLDLSYSQFPTGFNFSFFENLKKVQNLKCNEIKILESLGALEKVHSSTSNPLPKLQYLSLRCNFMIRESHEIIAKLPVLSELDLTGIDYLLLFESYFKLINPTLKIYPQEATCLDFQGTFVDLKSLSCPLTFGNLRKLDLSGSFFIPEDYVTLRADRPDLKIYPCEIADLVQQELEA